MLRKTLLFAGAIFASIAIASTAYDMSGETQEGYDKQSPEEIAQANAIVARDFANALTPEQVSPRAQAKILAQYSHLDPNHEVPTDLLRDALIYFEANKAAFPNQAYITIVDFKKRSNRHRFYLINLTTGAVEKYHTTHGIHSDKNKDGYAESFGNVPNSGKSSLGFVRTAEVYNGKYKRSVRLDGLSSTNSKIRERAIVFHGWDKVHEKDVIQGLSWGCITLDWAVKDSVLDRIKEGSLMYVGVAK